MQYWTWNDVKEKIENDMDLQEEPDILATDELMGYTNDAIDVCEQHFIKLGDYFFADGTITLVPGQRDYDLPEDIYATKIRKILKGECHEVKQMKDIASANSYAGMSGTDYCYFIINNRGATPKIRLFPTPRTADVLDIYYTRNAARLDPSLPGTQVIDVPEAMGYIITYLKMRVYEKEKSPLYQMYYNELEKQETLLMEALAQRIDDEDNLIEPDEYEGLV